MKNNNVYVLRTSPETVQADIARLLDTHDFQEMRPDKETFIKINANYDREWPGCNTSKWVLDAVLKNLRARGFTDVKAIEGDLKMQPASRTVAAVGIDTLLNKHGVPFVPIEQLPRENELPIILQGAQLISVPVLHTHTFGRISVACKNLYGLLPVYRERYHGNLPEKLLELAQRLEVFSIVDGTVGVEGGSMRLGNPKRVDLLLGGWNPIAVDVIAARIMGFSLDQVPHLQLALQRGMIDEPVLKGDFSARDLPDYAFEYKDSRLSKIDLWLRRNRVTGRFFSYNSLLDRLGNHARRAYTSRAYRKKQASVTNGDWLEYADERERTSK
jgi:uncharacterized protein (DUF362 family)